MIPISKDQKIKKEIDGVVYLFNPPIGELEIELISSVETNETLNIKPYYEEAVKILEDKYKGSRKPGKRKWEKLVQEEAMSLMKPEGGNFKKHIGEIDITINKVLCGWESNNPDVPKFPEDGNPAGFLPIALKQALFEWYWSHLKLEGGEAKNS